MKLENRVAELLAFSRYCRSAGSYPGVLELARAAEASIGAMESLGAEYRPRSEGGLPGGIFQAATRHVAIVPDLHGRRELIAALLASVPPTVSGKSAAELLVSGELTLVFLGDVLHTEGEEAQRRWARAASHIGTYPGSEGILSRDMDEEMGISLWTLALVMGLIERFPRNVVCLKGNHDNLGNLDADGDLPFYKYALEGLMGAEWFSLRYGKALLDRMREYERLLPLSALGSWFCASHAEPAFPLLREDLVEYREKPEIVRALIWTSNGQAAHGAVRRTLGALLGSAAVAGYSLWFSGHRPVSGGYRLRASDGFVQIHDPACFQAAWVENDPPEARKASLWSIDSGRMTLISPADTPPA